MKLTLTFLLFLLSNLLIGQALDITESTANTAFQINHTGDTQTTSFGINLTNGKSVDNANTYGYYSSIWNDGNGANNKSYATYSFNSSLGEGDAYGGFFVSSVDNSINNSCGIYARASGGQNNYAGYFDGKIKIGKDISDVEGAILDQTYTYNHSTGPQIFSTNSNSFDRALMASAYEGAGESYGFYADSDYTAIWNPGDGQSSLGVPTGSFIAIADEDRFQIDDDNPWDDNALIYYLTETGGWIASDINRKENIVNYESSLEKIKSLDVYSYKYKLHPQEVEKGQENPVVVGLLAQELQQAIPQAVEETIHGELFVNYNQVTSVLLGAVKELEAKVAELEAKLENR